jgi:uncharacterized Tic20 family protein
MDQTQSLTQAKTGMKPEDERMFGMLCHLLSLIGALGIPFGNIIGPLVVWLIKKDESAFVDKCGKDSLNFQISLMIYFLVCGILTFILIGFVGMLVLFIIGLVSVIQASIQANQGRHFVYPITIQFFK